MQLNWHTFFVFILTPESFFSYLLSSLIFDFEFEFPWLVYFFLNLSREQGTFGWKSWILVFPILSLKFLFGRYIGPLLTFWYIVYGFCFLKVLFRLRSEIFRQAWVTRNIKYSRIRNESNNYATVVRRISSNTCNVT